MKRAGSHLERLPDGTVVGLLSDDDPGVADAPVRGPPSAAASGERKIVRAKRRNITRSDDDAPTLGAAGDAESDVGGGVNVFAGVSLTQAQAQRTSALGASLPGFAGSMGTPAAAASFGLANFAGLSATSFLSARPPAQSQTTSTSPVSLGSLGGQSAASSLPTLGAGLTGLAPPGSSLLAGMQSSSTASSLLPQAPVHTLTQTPSLAAKAQPPSIGLAATFSEFDAQPGASLLPQSLLSLSPVPSGPPAATEHTHTHTHTHTRALAPAAVAAPLVAAPAPAPPAAAPSAAPSAAASGSPATRDPAQRARACAQSIADANAAFARAVARAATEKAGDDWSDMAKKYIEHMQKLRDTFADVMTGSVPRASAPPAAAAPAPPPSAPPADVRTSTSRSLLSFDSVATGASLQTAPVTSAAAVAPLVAAPLAAPPPAAAPKPASLAFSVALGSTTIDVMKPSFTAPPTVPQTLAPAMPLAAPAAKPEEALPARSAPLALPSIGIGLPTAASAASTSFTLPSLLTKTDAPSLLTSSVASSAPADTSTTSFRLPAADDKPGILSFGTGKATLPSLPSLLSTANDAPAASSSMPSSLLGGGGLLSGLSASMAPLSAPAPASAAPAAPASTAAPLNISLPPLGGGLTLPPLSGLPSLAAPLTFGSLGSSSTAPPAASTATSVSTTSASATASTSTINIGPLSSLLPSSGSSLSGLSGSLSSFAPLGGLPSFNLAPPSSGSAPSSTTGAASTAPLFTLPTSTSTAGLLSGSTALPSFGSLSAPGTGLTLGGLPSLAAPSGLPSLSGLSDPGATLQLGGAGNQLGGLSSGTSLLGGGLPAAPFPTTGGGEDGEDGEADNTPPGAIDTPMDNPADANESTGPIPLAEGESIVFEEPTAKLLKFNSDSKQWLDIGKCAVRLVTGSGSSRPRLVFSVAGGGKTESILLNASVLPSTSAEKEAGAADAKLSSVRITPVGVKERVKTGGKVEEQPRLTMITVKVRTPQQRDAIAAAVNKHKPTA